MKTKHIPATVLLELAEAIINLENFVKSLGAAARKTADVKGIKATDDDGGIPWTDLDGTPSPKRKAPYRMPVM